MIVLSRARILLSFTAAILLLSACGGGAATQETQPAATEAAPQAAEPVVLRVGMSGSPDSLNPGNA